MNRFKVALVSLDAPGIPDWVEQKLSEADIDLVFHECTTGEELAHHAGDADVVWVLSGLRVVTEDRLPGLKQCGAILRTGSGTDNIPIEAATRLGIVVANTPLATADTVPDHTIALLLAVLRQIPVHDQALHQGIWNPDESLHRWTLGGSTLGLVGFGHIAQSLVRKISGFDLTTMAYDPYVTDDKMKEMNVRPATLEAIWSQADFISLHLPLTEETRHLVGEKELRAMKSDAVLINTARGPIIDEKALVRALSEGWIGAAGLDVFETTPLPADHPLTKLPNAVLTPHLANHSPTRRHEFWQYSVETLIDLSKHRWPQSIVNPDVKPRWDLAK